ncbi:MAG: DUF1501 domain-containing protein [Planctomycetota bacterium]
MAMNLNSGTDPRAYTRREFVGTGFALASAALAMPSFLQRSALGLTMAEPGMSSIPGVPEDRVLVVIQLGGGNDGLNTVVPYGFDAYHNARRGIRVPEDAALKLGGATRDPIGLHPSLSGVKELFDDGIATIVQGVGYPNPNRSHFKSMDIWHTADTSATGDGWLGRYIDSECCGFGKGESGTAEGARDAGTIHPPVSIGREAPLALNGRSVKPVAFETPDLFRWTGEDVHPALVDPYKALTERSPGEADPASGNAAFLMKTALDAQIAGETIREAVDAEPLVQYPRSGLAQQLSMVASMVRAGMKTRVFYVTHGGFDTHAGQGGVRGRHANLLQQFGDAVNAFYRDLKAQGNEGRVLSLAFSEFGRRVGQNASNGTDHGTAAPVFMFGPMVKAGVANRHPSMTDLDNGDLKYTTDFRTVYAAILEDWMKADSRAILEGRYKAAPVIRKT